MRNADRLSAADWRSRVTSRRNKYRARRVAVDGVWFASQREAARYLELKVLAMAGELVRLELQPRYALDIVALYAGGDVRKCGHYTADFRYIDTATGEIIVEDVKAPPTRTTAYRLRKKIVEALYGIAIREV